MNTVTINNARINVSEDRHLSLLTGTDLNTVLRGGALFGFYHPKTKKSFVRAQYVLPTSYNGWTIKRLASLDSEAVDTKFAAYPLGQSVGHLGIAKAKPDLAVALPATPASTPQAHKRTIQCAATTKAGARCKNNVQHGSEFCGSHQNYHETHPKPDNLPKAPSKPLDVLNIPEAPIDEEMIPFLVTDDFVPSQEEAAFAASLI